MSSNNLKIIFSNNKMEIKTFIATKRPLNEKSLNTYSSVATSLYREMFNDDLTVETINLLNNPDAVMAFMEAHETKYKKLSQRKVVLSCMAVIFESDEFRKKLLETAKELNKIVDKQEMTQEQSDNWVDTTEIKTLLDKMEKNVNILYKKPNLTNADFQEIQQYIILCLYSGKYIAPRRSQDYNLFKVRNVDFDKDNYLDKNEFVFNAFKGRFTNTKTGVREIPAQRIPIPQELKKIIAKWIKTTTNDFLIFDVAGKGLNSPQLNQRINKMFGKDKGCGVNQMRHTHLTEKYAHTINEKKELIADMKAMGSSILEAKYYIQNQPDPTAGANGPHQIHITTEEEPVKKARKPRAKKEPIEPILEIMVSPISEEIINLLPPKVRKPRAKKTPIIIEA
jgi:hypothetical protein